MLLGLFEIEEGVMPNKLNDLPDVGTEVKFLLFPAGGEITVLGQDNWLGLSIGKKHQFAGFHDGIGSKIVVMPEFQSGDISTAKLDGGADEKALDQSSIAGAAEINSPGVSRTVGFRSKKIGRRHDAEFPCAFGFVGVLNGPAGGVTFQIVRPWSIQRLERPKGIKLPVVVID